MANQIGKFFARQGGSRGGETRAVVEIADHLQKFWDPRMRAAIVALSAEDQALLDPLPRRAVALLAHAAHPSRQDPVSPSG